METSYGGVFGADIGKQEMKLVQVSSQGIPQQRVDQGDRWKENRRSSEDSEPATLDKRLQKNHIADGTNGAESMLRVSFPKNPLRKLTMSDGRSDLTREPHPDHNFSISGR